MERQQLIDGYLGGNAGKDDVARLDALIREDPHARRELLNSAALETHLRQVLAQAEPEARSWQIPPRWRRGLSWAAALLLLLAAIAAFWQRQAYPAPQATGQYAVVGGGTLDRGKEVATGPGQAATLTLGGYCQVQLAGDTRLAISGGARDEAVVLKQGQVNCRVDHGIGAFTVRTELGDVHVTGTEFRVTIQDPPEIPHEPSSLLIEEEAMTTRKLLVSVVTGAVLITGPWGQTPVEAGETKIVNDGTVAVLAEAPAMPAPAAGPTGVDDAGTVKEAAKPKDATKRWDAEPPVKPRFEIKERDWPAQYGEASVCLWKDDALAVLSFTIDDNCFSDTPWWLEMGKKYDLRFTWFVITRRITKGENPGTSGTWEGWRKIKAAGHDVQSHTALHGHIEDPEWKGIEAEYANSKKDIEDNMPGHKCLVLGYFGGGNSYLNDPAIAAKYYIGARSSGLLNKANQINYMLIHTTGGISDFPIGDGQHASQDLKSLIEKGKGPMGDYYRGWMSVNSHFVGADFKSISDPAKREIFAKKFGELSAAVEKRLAAVQKMVQEGQLWVGLVREVCLYGQERDSAQLKVTEKAAGKIVFTLTDGKDDPRFDFPLTVKVRLDPSWKTVKATQNAKPIDAKLVARDGAVYALVQAVPDRGEVTLTNGSN